MPCFLPLTAFRRLVPPHTITFSKPRAYPSSELKLPCGRCVGCRLERSRQWAVRLMHEATLHSHNCFITLTYSPQHIPSPPVLVLRHYQLFMKRLRKIKGAGVRFYHCGEYGDKNLRPHYHACLFGVDFPDKKLWKIENGQRLYISAELEQIWGMGFAVIGEVTFESAAYVARYIMKKVNGDMAQAHYTNFDPVTGEVYYTLPPEYATMSRRPGLGQGWFDKFGSETYVHDSVVVRGREVRPPCYYDRLFKATRPLDFERIAEKRQSFAKNNIDNTPERLEIRRQVLLSRLSKLKRPV